MFLTHKMLLFDQPIQFSATAGNRSRIKLDSRYLLETTAVGGSNNPSNVSITSNG